MVELYLHSLIYLHGMINQLSTGITLAYLYSLKKYGGWWWYRYAFLNFAVNGGSG
jgi:hypothetical protein